MGKGVQILTPTGGADFSPYLVKLVPKIKKDWYDTIPDSARSGKKGKTIITFEIQRNGGVDAVSLEKSSGDDALDQAALKAVQDSAPYEALPTAFEGPRIKLRFIFLYNLPSTAAEQ